MQWGKWEKMRKNARVMAIQIRCQNWPLGEWRFWRKWQIWQKWRIWHNWRKIARGLAISRMWQIFKRDAKSGFLESSLVNDILNFCGIFFLREHFFCFFADGRCRSRKNVRATWYVFHIFPQLPLV